MKYTWIIYNTDNSHFYFNFILIINILVIELRILNVEYLRKKRLRPKFIRDAS